MPNHKQYSEKTEYYKNYAKKSRENHIDWYKNYDKQRQQKRKIEARKIKKELTLHGCAICGYNKCPAALDFHHVNPEDKKYTLNNAYLSRLTNDKLIEELNKCILLCSNCHRELHYTMKEVKNDERLEN